MNRIDLLLAVMTKTQRRRWRLVLKGFSIRRIARIEGVGHPRIIKSLAAGKKKAKKILLIRGQTGDQTP